MATSPWPPGGSSGSTTDTNVTRALPKIVEVSTINDLPPADGSGIRQLADDTAYEFLQAVALPSGERLVAPAAASCAIRGTSSETASLSGSGLGGSALITATATMVIQNISITATGGPAVDIDGSVQKGLGENVAFDWTATNFVDCAEVGTIRDFSNFVLSESALLNSGGLTFAGTFDTVAADTCLFDPPAATTAISVDNAAAVNRRFRIIYSAFVVLSGETGISLDSNFVSINNETYILDTVSFGGGGTYLVGDDNTSPSSLFSNCTGIANSASVANYYMSNNAAATTISLAGTYVKAAGVTLDGPNVSEFTQTANRATYTGNLTQYYIVTLQAAMTAGNNQQLSIAVAKNGTVISASAMLSTSNGSNRVESIGAQVVLELANGDYFEVWVANNANTTNITVTDLQVVARRIN